MNRRSRALGIVLLLALSGICTIVAVAQEAPLTNAEIVKLTKLEMGDAVIIAKIKAAREVRFDTSTDELVKLREAGVSKDVIAAMIERTAGPAAKAGGRPEFRVQLNSAEGVFDLKGMYGLLKTLTSRFGGGSWVQFVDLQANIRIRDRRPALVLPLDRDPSGGWWFVRLNQYRKRDETYRYFDLTGFGPGPGRGSVVPYEAVEQQPGLWRIRPLKDLRPGEYGLFVGSNEWGYSFWAFAGLGDGTGGVLFDFGIDE